SSPAELLERAAACGYEALALTDTNSLAGAVEFAEAARRCGVRPLLGAHLRHQGQRATALVAESAGYRSLCRIIGKGHAGKPRALAEALSAAPAGLPLLVDDPFRVKPPLPDAYRGRLWAEVVRPGRSEAAELGLLDVGSRSGVKPVASPAAYFPEARG